MSQLFVTSDLHFGHRNILTFNAQTRPFNSIAEMDDYLIKHWNSVVSPEDTVYNLGDFSFYRSFEKTKNILDKLNGKHILIKGNHDQVITKNADRLLNGIKEDGNPYLCGIYNYFELQVNNTMVVMFHYPISEWNRMHYGSVHLYGHLHDSLAPEDGIYRLCNVGYDNLGKITNLNSLVEALTNYPPKERL